MNRLYQFAILRNKMNVLLVAGGITSLWAFYKAEPTPLFMAMTKYGAGIGLIAGVSLSTFLCFLYNALTRGNIKNSIITLIGYGLIITGGCTLASVAIAAGVYGISHVVAYIGTN